MLFLRKAIVVLYSCSKTVELYHRMNSAEVLFINKKKNVLTA